MPVQTWVQGSWYIAGTQHTAPRSSRMYTLGGRQVRLGLSVTASSHTSRNCVALEKVLTTPHVQAFRDHAEQGRALDVDSAVGDQEAPACLQKTADLVAAAVTQLKVKRQAELLADDREVSWSSSYALANLYKDGSQTVGGHSGEAQLAGQLLQLSCHNLICKASIPICTLQRRLV